jgi:hypothetical protein
MDEVDGRPGHVALQFGFLEDAEDAPQDAPKLSLCRNRDQRTEIRGQGAADRTSPSIFKMTFTELRVRWVLPSKSEVSLNPRAALRNDLQLQGEHYENVSGK